MTGRKQPSTLARAGARVRRLEKLYADAVDDLGQQLLIKVEDNGMKPSDAAREAGISRQYAHKLLRQAAIGRKQPVGPVRTVSVAEPCGHHAA